MKLALNRKGFLAGMAALLAAPRAPRAAMAAPAKATRLPKQFILRRETDLACGDAIATAEYISGEEVFLAISCVTFSNSLGATALTVESFDQARILMETLVDDQGRRLL